MLKKVKWTRLTTWFLFGCAIAWIFGADSPWVLGTVLLSDLITLVLDETGN